jgi:hypothetical protein
MFSFFWYFFSFFVWVFFFFLVVPLLFLFRLCCCVGYTGAKLSIQLLNEMKRRNQKYGMVTACVGGGQGIAGIYERL